MITTYTVHSQSDKTENFIHIFIHWWTIFFGAFALFSMFMSVVDNNPISFLYQYATFGIQLCVCVCDFQEYEKAKTIRLLDKLANKQSLY